MMHQRRHALLLGRWMVSDERVVDHGSLARSPLGPAGWRADRGSKGGKGEGGLAKGSPFHPTHPGLVRCNDFKDASKAAPLLPGRSYPGLVAGSHCAVQDTP